jgi:hypothetical protein
MATGARRLDRRSSNLVLLAVPAAVAIAVGALAYQTVLDTQRTDRPARTAEPVRVSPRCLEADRARVAQLATFLQRNGSTDAPVLERAIHALNVARRHCLYDWEGRGLEDYQWLGRWLDENS